MQMTKMLDLLDAFLDELGHTASRLDGSMAWQDRCVLVDGGTGRAVWRATILLPALATTVAERDRL